MEQWKDIQGFEGLYQVSNLGNVKSLPKQKGRQFISWSCILSQKLSRGYLTVSLSKDKITKYPLVHQLVAQAFIPNPTNRPCVNHKDGDKQNNNADNLEWVDYFENMRHAVDTGLLQAKGINNSQCRLKESEVLEIYNSNNTAKQLAEKFKVSNCLIYKIKYGHVWNSVTGMPVNRNKKYKTFRYAELG